MDADVLAHLDLDDSRRRRPIAFLQARGEEASVRRKARAVRVAQAGGEDFHAIEPAQAQHALIARRGVEAALRVHLQADHVIMPAVGRSIATRDAFIEVGLVVAVEVVQTRDLISAEHVETVAHDAYAQGLVQAGRETLPADMLQVGVEPAHQPDLTGHRADSRGAVGEEVQAAQEHQRAIGIAERHGDGVGREGLTLPDRTLRLEPLRPLRRAALGQVRQLSRVLRAAPSGGEDLAPALRVTEDGLRAVAIEPAVDGPLGGLAPGLLAHDRPKDTTAVVEAVAHLAQLHETTLPLQGECQRHRIEARAAIALVDRDGLGNRQALAAEHAREHRAFVGLLPALVAPRDLVVLIALMAIAAAVEARVFGQQRRRLTSESRGLLRVVVVDAVTVHEGRPQARLRRMQRRQRRLEFGGDQRRRGGRQIIEAPNA